MELALISVKFHFLGEVPFCDDSDHLLLRSSYEGDVVAEA